jgi:hypothetical protein
MAAGFGEHRHRAGPGGNGNAVDLRGYEQWKLDENGLIVQSPGHYDEAEYQRQMSANP